MIKVLTQRIKATEDCEAHDQLTDEEWNRIFKEADDIGVSFILLAGGEPMMRRDVIEKAAGMSNMMFPIFTNGVFINDAYFNLFDKHRNLVPIMSIEGGRESTELMDAIESKLFRTLRDTDILRDDHNGGCVLFEKRAQVEAICG